jgi:hypothetical protein
MSIEYKYMQMKRQEVFTRKPQTISSILLTILILICYKNYSYVDGYAGDCLPADQVSLALRTPSAV